MAAAAAAGHDCPGRCVAWGQVCAIATGINGVMQAQAAAPATLLQPESSRKALSAASPGHNRACLGTLCRPVPQPVPRQRSRQGAPAGARAAAALHCEGPQGCRRAAPVAPGEHCQPARTPDGAPRCPLPPPPQTGFWHVLARIASQRTGQGALPLSTCCMQRMRTSPDTCLSHAFRLRETCLTAAPAAYPTRGGRPPPPPWAARRRRMAATQQRARTWPVGRPRGSPSCIADS